MPAYKYADHVGAIEGCPPPVTPASGTAYRLVHNPIRPADFVPKAKQALDSAATGVAADAGVEMGAGDAAPAVASCGEWGLSLFRSATQLRRIFGKALTKYPHMAEETGDHVARGQLVPEHGMVTQPNKKSTHFNLYEFEGVDMDDAFVLDGPVVQPGAVANTTAAEAS